MYRLTYTLGGAPTTFEFDGEDDLKGLLEEIETELRIRHPEIQKNPAFLVLLADGLLNSLAEDKTEIGLGELGVGA